MRDVVINLFGAVVLVFIVFTVVGSCIDMLRLDAECERRGGVMVRGPYRRECVQRMP